MHTEFTKIYSGMLFLKNILLGKIIHFILFFSFIIIPILATSSQSSDESRNLLENYYFRQLTVDDGLSQNMISSIYQDHLGFMWFGTKDGLNMFDGYNFIIFKFDPYNEFSLADNFITAIYEDSAQRLWVGTFSGGLHYFDRRTSRFVNFSHDPDNVNSISNNHIQAIIGDNNGDLWIGTNGGLNKLILTQKDTAPGKDNLKIIRFDDPANGFPGLNASIQTLFVDVDDRLWIGTRRNIYTYNTQAENARFLDVPFQFYKSGAKPEVKPDYDKQAGAQVIFEDNNGELWMGNNYGLFILDSEQLVFFEYSPAGKRFPVSDIIAATIFINRGNEEIWVSSEDKIYVLNPLIDKYTEISRDKYPNVGLQNGDIISLYADNGGTIWVGSNRHGLSLFSPETIKFTHSYDIDPEATGPVYSSRDLSIRSFYSSPYDHNTLWIGADQGLFKVDRKNSIMTSVRFTDESEGNNTVVFSLRGDDKGFIWIGSEIGLTRYNTNNSNFKLIPTGLFIPREGNEPRVCYVHLSNDNVWILTPNTIARLNQETGQFEHTRYNYEPLDRLRETFIPDLHEDRNGNFWIAAKNGLHYFDVQNKEIETYIKNTSDSHGRHLNNIKAIMADPEDPDRYLWIGTGVGGISRFDIKLMSFDNYSEKHGLPNNMVYGMLYDDDGSIWMSTSRGLSKLIINEGIFVNYIKADGLQSSEFNSGAFYKSFQGEMFFGGINGYNSFYPSEIRQKDFMAPLVFTGFTVLSENGAGEFPGCLNSINAKEHINLSYRQNSFTIEFASLDFANPDNNSFAYSMTTSEESWIYTGHSRSVTFNDLKPGNYTLRIRGTNSDGIWSNREASMSIAIEAPWWQQSWMYFIYLAVLAAIILGFRKYEMSLLRLRDSMRIANIEAFKLKELDQLKSQFFANISHEFRTPLTLIKGPLEQLSEKENDVHKKNTLSRMLLNATRLLQLINQLLDLSKIESNKYNLKVRRGDISALIKRTVNSFASLATQKSISLKIEENPCLLTDKISADFYYDPDIMEKIFNNLISNALKFTPENGSVIIKICLNKGNDHKEWLELVVSDTGIGIPADKLPFIYDRFYQVQSGSGKESDGSGIGLAYVKELLRIHKAEIRLRSIPGSGTTFSLRFPMGKEHYTAEQIANLVSGEKTEETTPGMQLHMNHKIDHERNEANNRVVPWVLIIEDHQDVSHYIAENLQTEYRVKEISNAKDGFKIAEELIPDLIISDIMMPGTDGYKLCEMIRSSEKTSHIPVILLTARTDDADRIMGLELGADDYLAKPFNVKELRTRVRNLIDSRYVLREKYSSGSIIKPDEISVNSRESAFMEKLLRIVETNIGNTAFSTEDLGREAGMSPSQIHRKLKATVNMPANHFIRSVRMHRAMVLLQKDSGNVADIAYMVGYDDPGYFTKTFRTFFGKLPSEIIRR